MLENSDRYLWTKHLMPMVYDLGKKIKKSNKKILISLPLTWETLCLIDAIKDKFKVTVVPLTSGKNSSLQPNVFKYLDEWRVNFFKQATEVDRFKALKDHPDIIIDCIFTVTELGLEKNLILPTTFIIEDTRTGSIKLRRALEKYKFTNPHFVLDDSKYKQNFENRIGIGYSVIAALMASGVLIKGKQITILGYGPVGQGLAEFASGLGAKVKIVEIDSNKILLARKHSFSAGNLTDFLETTDIFITATGVNNVISKKDILEMKSGAMLVNAGADFGEWDKKYLSGLKSVALTKHATDHLLPDGKHIIEFGGGNSFNLVSGISISCFLDVTFSLAIQAIRQFEKTGNKNRGSLKIEENYLTEIDNNIKNYF